MAIQIAPSSSRSASSASAHGADTVAIAADTAIESLNGQPGSPLAGLYTDGEVARITGPKGDHNHAVVTVSFA